MSGGARILQALSRDKIIPFIGIFGKGFGKGDEPIYATGLTFILVQVCRIFPSHFLSKIFFLDINVSS